MNIKITVSNSDNIEQVSKLACYIWMEELKKQKPEIIIVVVKPKSKRASTEEKVFLVEGES